MEAKINPPFYWRYRKSGNERRKDRVRERESERKEERIDTFESTEIFSMGTQKPTRSRG